MSDELVNNLKRTSAWLRVLFMLGFAVALYVVGVVLLVLMLAQILFSLITGDDNSNLRRLGSALTLYVSQILAFLTYNSEEKPFPFAPFPLVTEDEVDDVTAADTVVTPPSTATASTDPGMDSAADSAAQVMAESAARRAAERSPITASKAAKTSSATKTTAAKSAVRKTTASKKPVSPEPDAAPGMGVTDVVDKKANDV
ncbi:hypothetical protein PHACT_13060 [Pseudohongiella acticola]|uniref:Glucose-1-phosphate thymidylyltransferase n=1 Tax=Pseudohongiella acticola TaxID=1524254 RepID=A0A1E8CGA5_9GAMM|nr:DUF4389 domain-containing protein [Pseudohongiella acticola]OFE11474.1 hypothetical protein PHACT_13060 [Pseudohongiella acticola]